MKFNTHIIASLLLFSPCLPAEATAQTDEVTQANKDPKFVAFAEEVAQATKLGDAEALKNLTLIGDGAAFWEATKMGLQMMKNMKVKSSTYTFDGNIRTYAKKGVQWNLSAPAVGELTITLKIEPQDGDVGDETIVRYMVANTNDGWRVVLPTTKQQ